MQNYKSDIIFKIHRDLSKLGIDVQNIFDVLKVSKDLYLKAVPILLLYLKKTKDDSVAEQIIRVLSTPWAKSSVKQYFIEKLKENPTAKYSWALGNGISIMMDESDIPELINIVIDPKFGINRQMIVLGLGRFKGSEIEDTLISLLNDPLVEGHAISALRQIKSKKGYKYFELYSTHPKAWIRKEAVAALKQIDFK